MKCLIIPQNYINKSLSGTSRIKNLVRIFSNEDEIALVGNNVYKSNSYKFYPCNFYSISKRKIDSNNKKVIRSFEEFFYYYNLIQYNTSLKEINCYVQVINDFKPDVVLCDMNINAIIACRIANVKFCTTYNYTIFKDENRFDKGITLINKILSFYHLPQIIHLSDLFEFAQYKYIYSTFTDEPIADNNAVFVGMDLSLSDSSNDKVILVDLTHSSCSENKQIKIIKKAFLNSPYKVEMLTKTKQGKVNNIHYSPTIVKQTILGNASVFIHDATNINTELMIRYQVPGITVTNFFVKHHSNANLLFRYNCAFKLSNTTFNVKYLYESFRALIDNPKYKDNIINLANNLSKYNGSITVVEHMREHFNKEHYE